MAIFQFTHNFLPFPPPIQCFIFCSFFSLDIRTLELKTQTRIHESMYSYSSNFLLKPFFYFNYSFHNKPFSTWSILSSKLKIMQRSTHKCREREKRSTHETFNSLTLCNCSKAMNGERKKKQQPFQNSIRVLFLFFYFFFHTLSLFLLVDVIFSPFLSYRTFKTHCNRTKVYFGLYSVRRLFIRFYFLCILAH